MGVEVVLGERVVTWPDEPEPLDGKTKYVTTDKGRTFEADIVVSRKFRSYNVQLFTLYLVTLYWSEASRVSHG